MYDSICLKTFLEKQLQLYPEIVAETEEEAADFLEMCMAVVCKSKKEVRVYLKEAGVDLTECDTDTFSDIAEVFALPDGRYLIVEA